jgi:hypothetical protein
MKNLIVSLALFFVASSINAQLFEANNIRLSFDTLDGEKQLVWETPKEINTSYFIVYKSIDGITYEQIGRVQAKGSYAHPSQYHFSDFDTNTQATYKVVLVNMEGITTTSAPATFLELQNDSLIKNQLASKPNNIR